MKAVVANVKHASVTVEGEVVGKIDRGLLILLGITHTDTEAEVAKLADKVTGLRIFKDEEGRTNKGLSDVGGDILVISQFTLYADCKKGNRPSFIRAGVPDFANDMYEYIIGKCRESGIKTETGIFGADMAVSLVNDGPFTIVLDSDVIVK